jgi:NADPH:quinone reductase-like Zn-dependent oxidoreductase
MVDGRMLWKAVGSLSGVAAGGATRALLRAGWRRTQGGDPPANPAAPGTAWSEALIWAAASGVAIAVTRLVAQRGAAEAWRATTGRYPAGMESVTP